MMKKLLALVFAMGIFMTSTIYASADTYHYSTLSIFHGETHTGQIREYDEGFAAITMDVDTIHKYYSSDNYCELNMKYKKKQLFSSKQIFNYTKLWYTGYGGYQHGGTQESGRYYYTFRSERNGLSSDNVTMKHFT